MPALRQPKDRATEAHVVSGKMLRERLGVTKVTLWRYVQGGHINPGRRRSGVRGKFWTLKQANQLIRIVGTGKEPFAS